MNDLDKLTLTTVIHATPDHVASDLDGETIVLNAESGQYYGLEGVGRHIWERIQQPVPIQELCMEIQKEYGVTLSECKADVLSFAHELLQENLIKVIT
ncbi:MAG: lasso peptide biosynthesis PqqD family chaperone [Caldilineaceae bacterium]